MMKIKIFALIMAILCILTVFASCDTNKSESQENEVVPCETHTDENSDNVCDVCSAAIPAVCAEHKDENADKICDACGLAVVVINQLVPPTEEERVAMVVNPLPEKNNLYDYVSFEDSSEKITSFKEVEGKVQSIYNNRYAYIVNTVEDVENETEYKEYSIVDLVADKTVYKTDDENGNIISLSPGACFFTVIEQESVEENNKVTYETVVHQYIGYDGEVLFDVVKEYEDVEEWSNYASTLNNDVVYYTFDDTVYAFDAVTYEKIATLDKLSLVYRPTYAYTTEDYGYIYLDNTIFVYDLNNWVECLYSYTIPSYYQNANRFYINDGKILVQAEVSLLSSATSYDFVRGGAKYDLVYVVIDPATKTATEVEFGYYIISASDISTDEKALNKFIVNPIVDDRINSNQRLYLVADKDFNVTVGVDNPNFYFVDKDVILVTEIIGANGASVRKLVNATTGELIAYVADKANVHENYITYDGKYYDFNMKPILDPVAEEYNIYETETEYMILTKTVATEEDPESFVTEYYFFSADKGAVKLDFVNLSVRSSREYGYIISHEVEKVDEKTGEKYTATVYTFINNENEVVFTSDYPISESSQYEEGYVFYTDGTYYVAK